MTNYKGYSLFSDIEDPVLRLRNRAVVMANMYEDHPDPSNKEAVGKKGALLIFGYIDKIPEKERSDVVEAFYKQMQERGYRSA